jgi:hypothetical protein
MNPALLWLISALCCMGVASIMRVYKAASEWRRDALEATAASRYWREHAQWLAEQLQDERKRKQDGVYR